jgi:post-segregation antitoxin (ccd killing protein)
MGVYYVCMSRVNIYLPDDLAAAAKEAGVNLSQIAQEALRNELGRNRTAEWVTRVRKLAPTGVTHDEVMAALNAAREEMGTRIA